MAHKQRELPSAVARAFVEDVRAYFAETSEARSEITHGRGHVAAAITVSIGLIRSRRTIAATARR
jgi:hypothetical protein